MSTHLIFLSDYVRDLVKKNFHIDKPCMIVPHGLIDYGELAESHRQSAKPTLLFLGRVSKYKGVDLLMEAMKQVDDSKYSKLIIAGKWGCALPDENRDCGQVADER